MQYILVIVNLYIMYVLPLVALAAILYYSTTWLIEKKTRNEATKKLADMLGISVDEAKKLIHYDPIY